MAKLPEMDAEFARWYADAFMEEGPVRAARWKGVVDTAVNSDFNTVEVLVRLAFSTNASPGGSKTENLEEKYRAVLSTISGNGTALDPNGSRRELQILAAAVLVRLFSRLPDAAIAVTNASFEGARNTNLPMDLAGLATRAIGNLAKKKHDRPTEGELKITAPRLDFEVSAEALASMTAAQWSGEFSRLRDVFKDNVRQIADAQNSVIKLLSRQIALGEEELQMLWWLVGGRSSTLDLPFAKVDGMLKPLIFSDELGELTEISPGPASVRALLSRAGVEESPLKVMDVINAVDIEWARTKIKSKRVSPVTTPLHFALEKRVEVGSKDAWAPVWDAMTGLPSESSMPAIRLAELFYREILFLYVNG